MWKKNRYKLILVIILSALFVVLVLLSKNKFWVEAGYSTRIYPGWAAILRYLFGWIPFSLGDVLYSAVLIFVLWKAVLFLIKVFRRKYSFKPDGSKWLNLALALLLVLCFFYLSWGMNYYRRGIDYQLGLENAHYKQGEVERLTNELVAKVNRYRDSLVATKDTVWTNKQIFQRAVDAYKEIDHRFFFLHFKNPSIKASLFGELGNYVGFLGYYNPFTGESQVNITVPDFVKPFVCCHEIAHQLGYASESEANFVGYLAASTSKDNLLKYSTYLDMFMYAHATLFVMDSLSAKKSSGLLSDGVKRDILKWNQFQESRRNRIEPLMNIFYDYYLKANDQAKGIRSYSEVIGWLIAYKKKFGEAAL